MSDPVSFFCPGQPVSQGSKRVGRQGQIYESSSKKLKVWRETIGVYARSVMQQLRQGPYEGPVELYLEFRFARPDSHMNLSRALRSTAPEKHIFKPDLDKLVRAVLDSLTGIVYEDDRQVVHLFADKAWVTEKELEGVQVLALELRAESEARAQEDTLA